MSAPDPLADALALATEQLVRLRADDFEAYQAALPGYEARCAEVATAVASTNEFNALRLNDLIELQRQIAAQLDSSKQQLSRRMTALRVARRANGAYLAHVAIPQQPIGQA